MFNSVLAVRPDPSNFELDLPDPYKDELSSIEFIDRLEKAWSICDRFDLQTEIWRGRILRAVRDREKRGDEGRGAGFLQWLRERDISKTRAYGLIQLADSADDLVGGGILALMEGFRSQGKDAHLRRNFIGI